MTRPSDAPAQDPPGRPSFQLVALAAAILYLELAIIRFTSAQVLYLGFFSNFILISAFVGLGLGFLAAKRAVELRWLVPFVLLALFALVLLTELDVDALRNRGGLFFFGNRRGRSGLPAYLMLPLLFVGTVALFAALAQQTGRLFARFTPLRAYTLDIVGSLLGIGLFSLQSLLWTGPVTWVVTGSLILALAYLAEATAAGRRQCLLLAGSVVAVVALLLALRPAHLVLWSAYQKLELRQEQGAPGHLWFIYANGILHQFIRPAAVAKQTFYQVPYEVRARAGGRLDDVLIIGAGSGTDVAVALDNGARRVDAVEIDEGIVELGRRHPDRPYADPRVTVHVTDGRHFLRNARRRYDLILFALPDSLVQYASMGNLRLESYLFTLEAFEEARARLKPGGILVLYNQYRWDWLRRRIALMLARVFGHPPAELKFRQTTFYAAGAKLRGRAIPRAGAADEPPLALATDEWPFVYMQRPGIGSPYMGMIGMFLLCSLLGVALLAPRGTLRRPDWPFFFLGAAFLLLETKSISLFSLLFGTTWMANSLAFGGILLSVLVANFVVARLAIRRRVLLFVALLAVLAAAYAVPSSALLGVSSPLLRYGCALVLIFTPVFLANLIFSREFRDTAASARAFGWNLLGAVAGGGLEYLSLLVGHRDLLWVVAACYLLAGLALWRGSKRQRSLAA